MAPVPLVELCVLVGIVLIVLGALDRLDRGKLMLVLGMALARSAAWTPPCASTSPATAPTRPCSRRCRRSRVAALAVLRSGRRGRVVVVPPAASLAAVFW